MVEPTLKKAIHLQKLALDIFNRKSRRRYGQDTRNNRWWATWNDDS